MLLFRKDSLTFIRKFMKRACEMHKYFFLFSLFIVLGFDQAISQEVNPLPKWKLNEISFHLGVQSDHYASMSLSDMMALAADPEQLQRDLSGLTEEASTTNTGGILFLQYGFNPRSKDGLDYRADRQLQFGISYHTPKEAMLTYKNRDMDTSLVYCNIQSELNLSASMVFRGHWGQRDQWLWHAGLGSSFGYTFDNAMILIAGKYFEPDQHPSEQPSDEMNVSKYEAKSVYYTRIYIPYGLHYVFGDHFTLGLDLRIGTGIQKIQGSSANMMSRTSAFMLGAGFRF